ncbi:MAG: hypothetical protein AB7P04_04790 [Bacteriovoracia bacterium]
MYVFRDFALQFICLLIAGVTATGCVRGRILSDSLVPSVGVGGATAIAGVMQGDSLTLRAEDHVRGFSGSLTYSWRQVSGPAVLLPASPEDSGTESAHLTFTAPDQGATQLQFELTVTALNPGGQAVSKKINVPVDVYPEPTLARGPFEGLKLPRVDRLADISWGDGDLELPASSPQQPLSFNTITLSSATLAAASAGYRGFIRCNHLKIASGSNVLRVSGEDAAVDGGHGGNGACGGGAGGDIFLEMMGGGNFGGCKFGIVHAHGRANAAGRNGVAGVGTFDRVYTSAYPARFIAAIQRDFNGAPYGGVGGTGQLGIGETSATGGGFAIGAGGGGGGSATNATGSVGGGGGGGGGFLALACNHISAADGANLTFESKGGAASVSHTVGGGGGAGGVVWIYAGESDGKVAADVTGGAGAGLGTAGSEGQARIFDQNGAIRSFAETW